MNAKLVVSGLVFAVLLIPVEVYSEDADGPHPVAFVKDSIITTKIKTKLAAEKFNTLAHIQVNTDRSGVVYLSGRVNTQSQADRAIDIARGTNGVQSVTNDIVVRVSH